ncbi:hypothetical protein [Halomonas sp. WWR20]
MSNIDDFNLVVGLAFEDALSAFPRPVNINERRILSVVWNEAVSEPGGYDPVSGRYDNGFTKEQDAKLDFIRYSIKWLVDEGFLRYETVPEGVSRPVVLTSTGHAALGSRLESVAGQPEGQTFGDKLRTGINDAAWTSVKQTVSTVLLFGAKAGAAYVMGAP